MVKNSFKLLLMAVVLSMAYGGIAESAQTINGKALGSVDDVVKEINRGDLSLPKKGLITLRGGDKIGDVDIFATTFGADASSSTKRIYHNSNATSPLNWNANEPYYLRPAVSRRLYNGKRVLMTHNLAPNGQLTYYFKALSNNRSENLNATTPSALTDSVQISDFGEYTSPAFANANGEFIPQVYGTGVMSVKGYEREIFVGASGITRYENKTVDLPIFFEKRTVRTFDVDNEVRLEFFAVDTDAQGTMTHEPLTALTQTTPFRNKPYIVSLAVGDFDGDKYDNEVALMINQRQDIYVFVYRLTVDNGRLVLRSLGDANGFLVHSTDKWGNDLESQPTTDMAVGDFDGDGRDEIAVIFKFTERATGLANPKGWSHGPMTGSVHCRVLQWNATKRAFDIAGTIQNYNKQELVDSATNTVPSARVAGIVGLRATAADLDGDGKDEIVTLLLGYYHVKRWDSKMNPFSLRIDSFCVFPHLAVWTFNNGSIKPVHDNAHIMGGGKLTANNGDNLYDFNWLNEHSANKKGLLMSDTEPLLKYQRSWQRMLFPFPMDPTESTDGTNPDDITHMYALVEFSIAAGPFTGTLGTYKTVDDIAVSWKRNGEDRVTIFKTNLNAGKQFDGFADGKLVIQDTKSGGTWRGLIAADFAGEGVELDRPTHLKKQSQRSYIAALSAVPYHVDTVSADGTAIAEQPTNFTYSEPLTGGNMTVSYGKSTTTNESNTVKQDLSQSVETMFIADLTGTDTKVQGVFGTVKGLVGFASAIGEIVHGAKIGGMSTEEKRNAVWKPDSPTAGLTDIMDFLTDKVDKIDQRTNSETSTTTIDKEITATTHDAVLYTDTARHIWRYPVMTRPLPMWLTWGPRIDSNPIDDVSSVNGDKELYLTFTMSENSALKTTSSVTDSLYQPLHEEGNFFSYPPNVADVEGYNDAGLLIETQDEWDFSNTIANTGISFTKATSNMQHTEKTVTPSGFTQTVGFFDKLINGDKATGLKMPDSDNPKTFSKEYSKNEKISYTLQGSDTLTNSVAGHTVKMQPFVAKEGAMTLGTAVKLATDSEQKLWSNNSIYQKYPDPALLLPFKFHKSGGVFEANTYDQSAMQIRGIRFYVPDFAFYSDNRLVNGLNYEIRVPLYNASFKDTGNFRVRLSYATDNSPNAPKTLIQEITMPSIGGWDNNKNNNKGTAIFSWTPNLTSNKKAANKKYYFYVEIDPQGSLTEVHEARYDSSNTTINDYGGNNTGFSPFYVYDVDDAESSGGTVISSAADEIKLAPLTFKDGNDKTITDIANYVITHSNDSFVTMTAEFNYSGPEVPYAYFVGYVLTPSGKQKLPNASINTIVDLSELEIADVSEVFMLNDIALFKGNNKLTFTFSPADLIAETKDIDSTVANSATFGILTLTEKELQAVEEFYEGEDPTFELEPISDDIVASGDTKTYTLNADENVFWLISSVKISGTVSTSDAEDEDDDRDYLDITLETVSEDEAAPSNYGQTAIITVSSIAGYTPKGNYEITVQKSADGDEWTDVEVLKFNAVNAEDDGNNSGVLGSSGGGCNAGLGLGTLILLMSGLMAFGKKN